MEVSARALYRSLRAFAHHPDWLQIWPGHGAGSSCGKGISAIPQSTLGYERRFNWAFQMKSEAEFVARVLEGQPDPPKYFATMKRVNREGPKVLGGFPSPPRLDAGKLPDHLAKGRFVVDIRRAAAFATGHVPGTVNIPINGSFATWAGWLMPYDADVFLLADQGERGALDVAAAVRAMALIGLDRVAGWFDTSAIDAWSAAGKPLGMIPQLATEDLEESIKHNGVTLVDVRNDAEWSAGHIAAAVHIPLGRLTDRVSELPHGKPIVLQCQTGSRSAIAASLLRARGFDPVLNLAGGISTWVSEGREVETGSEVAG